MESEWLRLEHRGTCQCGEKKIRQWFSCEVPDEDENSGDDDWCHIADVFIDIQSGIVARIYVVASHDIDTILDSEVESGNFQKVIMNNLRTLCETPFDSEVPFYFTKFKAEEDYLYFQNAHELI